jgi:hypothetical protein
MVTFTGCDFTSDVVSLKYFLDLLICGVDDCSEITQNKKT